MRPNAQKNSEMDLLQLDIHAVSDQDSWIEIGRLMILGIKSGLKCELRS